MPPATSHATGKVYLITVGDKRYVGSTVTTLAERLSMHRHMTDGPIMRRLYDAVQAVGWDAVRMTLLEDYPCSSSLELRMRERHWYDELQPELNTVRPAITEEERAEQHRQYYRDHSDEIRARVAQYALDNRDKVLENKRQYRANNPNAFKEWAASNKEALAERKRAYRKANADKIRAYEREYRARKKAAAAAAAN